MMSRKKNHKPNVRTTSESDIAKMQHRVAIVANPTSGGGAGQRQLDDVTAALARRSTLDGGATLAVQPFPTTRGGEGGAKALEALRWRPTVLVVIGGDGTLSECVHAIFSMASETAAAEATAHHEMQDRKSVPPVVVPPIVYMVAGTGSDFSRLGFCAMKGDDVANAILDGVDVEADVGFVRGLAPAAAAGAAAAAPTSPPLEQLRYFINIASVGLGPGTVVRAERYKGSCCRLFGGGCVFCCAGCVGLCCGAPLEVKLRPLSLPQGASTYGGGETAAPDPRSEESVARAIAAADAEHLPFLTISVASLAFCNGRFHGGGLQPSPTSRIDSHVLESVAWTEGFCGMLCGLAELYNGKAAGWKSTTVLRNSCFQLLPADAGAAASGEHLRFECDGELGPRAPAVIGIVPGRRITLRCMKS